MKVLRTVKLKVQLSKNFLRWQRNWKLMNLIHSKGKNGILYRIYLYNIKKLQCLQKWIHVIAKINKKQLFLFYHTMEVTLGKIYCCKILYDGKNGKLIALKIDGFTLMLCSSTFLICTTRLYRQDWNVLFIAQIVVKIFIIEFCQKKPVKFTFIETGLGANLFKPCKCRNMLFGHCWLKTLISIHQPAHL